MGKTNLIENFVENLVELGYPISYLSHYKIPCSKGLPQDLAAWGKENIGIQITAPELPFANARLIEVSKCTLGDCATAHLVYMDNGKRFSVFIIPENEADFTLSSKRKYTVEIDGHQVKIWKVDHQVYALVT